MKKPKLSVVGGTGALGSGLAIRLARAGFDVTIGSRDAERAKLAAADLARATGSDSVRGDDNISSARQADIVFVTVPFASQRATLADIAAAVKGKIVVDTTVPLVPPKVARVQLPEEGSAAAVAASVLGGDVTLLTGYHNVSAHKLSSEGETGCDVLIFGDDIGAREKIVEITNQLGVRGLHGGPLANSVAAEAMTSLLIAINKRYKVKEGAGIMITGLEAE
ncbi:NADPH-dependent F420 reductase [Leisingera daeponensis]|uniref:NADPH-dependent F420 reductase n=1 Tax=Leisingera daeponensis TaxID=405746 RepID=UPI001C9703F6|nr:NADPH-dependent F420 reductase [Leisingera daeponensis]MBY6058763.1 NADPH-dependent F420 reductase [Leisingera daeponensis]